MINSGPFPSPSMHIAHTWLNSNQMIHFEVYAQLPMRDLRLFNEIKCVAAESRNRKQEEKNHTHAGTHAMS